MADCFQTYDKTAISALVGTLRFLFELRPSVQALISGAVRNAETFETFRNACRTSIRDVGSFGHSANYKSAVRNKFHVEKIDFEPSNIREQTALFYATAVPLKILSITRPS